MAVKFRSLSGIDNAGIAAGYSVSEIPGEGGAGPLGFVIFLSASGLPANDPTISIEIITPANPVKFSNGTDGDGNISVTVTWINTGNDQDFLQAGGGAGNFPDGFWNTEDLIRGNLTIESSNIAIDIQFSSDDVIDFDEDLVNPPDTPSPHDKQWDGFQGQVTLDIPLPDLSEDPDSIAVTRDDEVIAAIPVTAETDYSFIDTVFAPGTYEYKVFTYKYPNSRSAFSSSAPVSFGGSSTITMTMSGGITFGGSATIAFIGNPTGTYTIVKDKTNDTLYNTEEDVAIPNPFIVTGFLPQ